MTTPRLSGVLRRRLGRAQDVRRVVVLRVVGRRAVVDRLVPELAEAAQERLLELEAGVVGPQVHAHVLESGAWPCWAWTGAPAAGSRRSVDGDARALARRRLRRRCCDWTPRWSASTSRSGCPRTDAGAQPTSRPATALGPQRSSVFFAPPRVVLEAVDQPDATRLSRAAGSTGVSIQMFHILGKVAEVDALLRADAGRRGPGGRGAPGGVVPRRSARCRRALPPKRIGRRTRRAPDAAAPVAARAVAARRPCPDAQRPTTASTRWPPPGAPQRWLARRGRRPRRRAGRPRPPHAHRRLTAVVPTAVQSRESRRPGRTAAGLDMQKGPCANAQSPF